jgi:O-antigen/teichoic acid export membrane protein
MAHAPITTKKLIGNTGLFLFSGVFSRAVPFLLLPVLTRYLSAEDYGLVGFLGSLTALVGVYVGLQPHQFLIVKGSQSQNEGLAGYIGNIFWLGVATCLLATVVLWALGDLILPEPLLGFWIPALISFLGLLRVGQLILETLLQIDRNPLSFAAVQLTSTVTHFGIALVLIIPFQMGWVGKFAGELAAAVVVFVIAWAFLARRALIDLRPRLPLLRELVGYLFPLSFHVLGLVLINSIDRIFIANMIGLQAAGLYTVAYSFGMVIGLVHESLQRSWNPFFYENIASNDPNTNRRIVRLTYFYLGGSGLVLAAFVVTAPWIFQFMVDKAFYVQPGLIAMVALGYTFEGARKLGVAYLLHHGRVVLVATLTLSAGAINVALNFWLIPINGIMGAAQATTLSFLVVAVASFTFAQRLHPMPWRDGLRRIPSTRG